MLDKLKNNKPLKIIGTIIYVLAFILVILILLVVLLQRISNNEISFGGFRIYNTLTGSMIPKYEIGDILLSKEVNPEDIVVGDDITYVSNERSSYGKLITHSVIEIREEDGKYYFVTQGIANNTADPEISEDQVYGKVIYKSVILSFINKLIRNMYVFYFLIIVPMAIIIARMIVNHIIRKDEERLEKEKEENRKSKEKIEKIEEKESNGESKKEDAEENNETNVNLIANNKTEEKKIEINDQANEDVKKKKENNKEKNKKKSKIIGSVILKKIKIKHIIILILLLAFNTLAWFIYATEVSTSLSAHVTSWEVVFASGDGEIENNIQIDLDRIYPGMETYETNIEVLNKGESTATLSYSFQSITILGETFEVGENMTSEELENKIKEEYPFKVNITTDAEELEQGGRSYYRITFEWPYESGNDELDTYWGNRAYEYYSLNPGDTSLNIKIELKAVQN